MQISLQNLQKRIVIRPRKIVQTVKKILLHQKIKDVDLSIVFVTDQKIKSINKKYLHHDYSTDVLSFDLSEGSAKKPKKISGEIFISAATAKRNAKEYDVSLDAEIELYLIHGILHLLGFDDHKPKDIKKMCSEEAKVLKYLKR